MSIHPSVCKRQNEANMNFFAISQDKSLMFCCENSMIILSVCLSVITSILFHYSYVLYKILVYLTTYFFDFLFTFVGENDNQYKTKELENMSLHLSISKERK